MDSKTYLSVFPNTTLNDSNVVTVAGKALRNSDVFEIVGRQGSYYSVGVGGGLTGKSVDIGIIDDPFKDRAEADSTTIRNKVWEWYVDVFLSRLPNSGRKLMLFTRWHEDDIAGRILASDQAKDWTVLKFEAIKETENIPYDIRQIGEALWPEKHGLEKLLKTKELNPHTFSALYQQRPTAAEGGLFRRKWFEIISFAEFAQIAGEKVVKFFIDPAYTKKTSNDPTGFLASVYIRNTWYILNAHDAYIDSSELSDYIKQYTAKQGYTHKSVIYVEPKASGLTLTQLLRKDSGLNVLEYKFDKRSGISLSSDKYTRAASIVSVCASLRVILVQGDWNQAFINQLTTFPNAAHDDLVDCLVMSIMESLYSDTTSTKDVLAALL
jgi:predicted phage terminase large subunit-like protein